MTALTERVVELLSFDFEGQPVTRTAGELFAGS